MCAKGGVVGLRLVDRVDTDRFSGRRDGDVGAVDLDHDGVVDAAIDILVVLVGAEGELDGEPIRGGNERDVDIGRVVGLDSAADCREVGRAAAVGGHGARRGAVGGVRGR